MIHKRPAATKPFFAADSVVVPHGCNYSAATGSSLNKTLRNEN